MIIKDWEDISLLQYSQIYNILMEANLAEDEKMCFMVQELYGTNIMHLPITEVRDKLQSIANLLSKPIPTSLIQNTYKINDIEYVLTKDLAKITTAQYMDYMEYLNGEIKNVNTYHVFLSIFLVPKGEEYNNGNYNITKVQNDILNMSIVDVLGIADFFLSYYKQSLNVFRRYLQHEVITAKGMSWKEKKQILVKIKDGDYSL